MRNFIDAFTVSTSRKLKAFRNSCKGNVSTIAAAAAIPMMI